MKNPLNNLLVQQLYRVFIQLYKQILRSNKCICSYIKIKSNWVQFMFRTPKIKFPIVVFLPVDMYTFV